MRGKDRPLLTHDVLWLSVLVSVRVSDLLRIAKYVAIGQQDAPGEKNPYLLLAFDRQLRL